MPLSFSPFKFLGILILTFSISMVTYSKEPEALKYAIVSALTMPLANVQLVNGLHTIKEDQGVLIELGKNIAKELNMPLKFVPIASDMITSSLMNGQSDILCYLVPQWVSSAASSFKWTDPFMEAKDILISIKSDKKLSTFHDLKGLNIGLIKHYSYPVLQSMIDQKEIFPIYSTTEINSFMQLFRNPDIDAIVFKDINFDWLFNAHSGVLKNKEVVKHPLVIEYIEPKCAVSQHRKLDMKKINKVIRQFKKSRFPS